MGYKHDIKNGKFLENNAYCIDELQNKRAFFKNVNRPTCKQVRQQRYAD